VPGSFLCLSRWAAGLAGCRTKAEGEVMPAAMSQSQLGILSISFPAFAWSGWGM
jgi:hypothetical protein